MSSNEPGPRDYPMSSNKVLDLIAESDIRIDELHAQIAAGEEVSAEEAQWAYQFAYAELRGGLQILICDAISAAIQATADAITGGAR